METSPPRLSSQRQSTIGTRKRTSRACDKCSSSRVRCDGKCPCRRCEEYGYACHYARDIRKRGPKPGCRKSRHDSTAEIRARSIDGISPRSDESIESHQSISEEPTTIHIQLSTQNTQESGHQGDAIDPNLETFNRPHSFSENQNTTRSRFPDQTHTDIPESIPVWTFDQSNPKLLSASTVPRRSIQPDLSPRNGACKYKCLEPVLSLLEDIIDADLACDLLEFYFAEPGGSLFRCASPYVLTYVLRKNSLLHPTKPRATSPALLITILWVSAQTAENTLLLLPGQRTRVCERLRKIAMSLIHDRDRDHWHRNSGGRLIKEIGNYGDDSNQPTRSVDYDCIEESFEASPRPVQESLDDLLSFILLAIVISGGDFKTDCLTWWSKAVRLSRLMGLNRIDAICDESTAGCNSVMCRCKGYTGSNATLMDLEMQEERRRVFWLFFCLDRHFALSFNSILSISDEECEVFTPLPEKIWESLDSISGFDLTKRNFGPPTIVSGTGFFEYFLPLMAILGDVIQVHHRKTHPRLGVLDNQDAITLVEGSLATCAQSINDMAAGHEIESIEGAIPASQVLTPSSGFQEESHNHRDSRRHPRGHAQAQLVTAYSTFILHVLHVLLHGKWDAISMLENKDDWITSVGFMKCASHAIAASEAVSKILTCDPELTFMPYLFGIYLLHGSFILLLFADRMPQIGLNESVEKACEVIIRAHEVCVVTLSTEFQKRFRKVLRSTLYSVRSAGATNIEEESKARRRALSLYRWTNGSNGLAL